jgi:pimeloyl-ACP methyl ester carboxylesterase
MIHYDRVNNGRRELVLVHGFLGGTGYWKPLFPGLKDHFGLIAVDLPGFAGSAAIPAPDSIAGLSQALLELMDSLDVERFSLLGFSMGGMVAMQTALDHRDRLENLILYGTAASGTLPNRFESWDTSIARMQEQGVEATADRTVSTWFVDGERHPYYSACREACRGASQESCIKLMRAIQRWSAIERLNEIKIPTLLIVGDKDRSTKPSESIAIWERIPGSQLCILPNGAHGVHMEKPNLFSRIIVDFLSRA